VQKITEALKAKIEGEIVHQKKVMVGHVRNGEKRTRSSLDRYWVGKLKMSNSNYQQ